MDLDTIVDGFDSMVSMCRWSLYCDRNFVVFSILASSFGVSQGLNPTPFSSFQMLDRLLEFFFSDSWNFVGNVCVVL